MSLTKKKVKLFEKSRLCHWCKREMKLILGPMLKEPDVDMATIDHIFHRFDPMRKSRGNQVVLACYGCNKKRGIEEVGRNKELAALRTLLGYIKNKKKLPGVYMRLITNGEEK